MKTLQSDLTTPEQSKRLLELGVPAESANYYYQDYRSIPMVVWTETQPLNLRRGILKPCWSVGRLNEIFKICSDIHIDIYDLDLEGTQIERAMQAFEDYSKYNSLDFSKLEE